MCGVTWVMSFSPWCKKQPLISVMPAPVTHLSGSKRVRAEPPPYACYAAVPGGPTTRTMPWDFGEAVCVDQAHVLALLPGGPPFSSRRAEVAPRHRLWNGRTRPGVATQGQRAGCSVL